MTEVLQSSPSHFSSPSSSSSTPCAPTNYNTNNNTATNRQPLVESTCTIHDIVQETDDHDLSSSEQDRINQGVEDEGIRKDRDTRGEDQLSLLTLLLAACRKSLVGCSVGKELCSMEIGLPTNVRHVAHVTFDRFNGFLGLPVEFEPEVPRRPPSARSISLFFL